MTGTSNQNAESSLEFLVALIAASAWGAAFAALGAWFAVKFLTRHFKTNTLTPFAVYCLAIGIVSLIILR